MPTAAQPLIETLSGDMPDLLRPIKVQKRCASAGPILQVKSGSVTVPVYRCGDGRLPRFFIDLDFSKSTGIWMEAAAVPV